MNEAAKNVFCFGGTDVNWVILREGTDLTLIDGGWPGDVPAVENSIRSIGSKPEDLRAILLTHAHIDHMGAVENFHRRFGTPVYADPIEVHHARREYLEQASADDVDKGPMPQTQEWWEKVQEVGATEDLQIDDVKPVSAGPLDIPGRPIAVPTHGHTSGHAAFHLPDSHAVITGDALLTAHPTSQFDGPQLCPWFFAHSPPDALTALDALEVLDAEVILPGHGDPLRMHIADAVGIARSHAHDSGYDPTRKA
ncbi:MBL fold metallo-hydrolase [Saccharopolyspora indica]|uniref:MBL fold metallo-hydrolase n=1 Tax=Saccharopolyspora indica TaxID=1229659 RepID=UPI0022EB65F8|nr:MBL fold metallo-hydrolase [Saccharopolyspora indica]MDA3643095.1 MBL fold metallo-hydrolase [Saccharopolyspora indica]